MIIFVDKSGVEPSKTSQLAKHIIEGCTGLEMCGLMTIGAYDYDVTLGPNPDFQVKYFKFKFLSLIIEIYLLFFSETFRMS